MSVVAPLVLCSRGSAHGSGWVANVGTPAEQLARLKEAFSTHDYRHSHCPAATLHEEFIRELPAHHKSQFHARGDTIHLGAAPGQQTLPRKDVGSTHHGPNRRSPSCPVGAHPRTRFPLSCRTMPLTIGCTPRVQVWPIILWNSVPEAVADRTLRTFATRAGVRVIEVMRMRWNPEVKEFARCNALFYAPRLNNPSASHVWFYWLQINQMYKKGTGPFLVRCRCFLGGGLALYRQSFARMSGTHRGIGRCGSARRLFAHTRSPV
jgi:hypothetical protein